MMLDGAETEKTVLRRQSDGSPGMKRGKNRWKAAIDHGTIRYASPFKKIVVDELPFQCCVKHAGAFYKPASIEHEDELDASNCWPSRPDRERAQNALAQNALAGAEVEMRLMDERCHRDASSDSRGRFGSDRIASELDLP
jgi:hypothetical protein